MKASKFFFMFGMLVINVYVALSFTLCISYGNMSKPVKGVVLAFAMLMVAQNIFAIFVTFSWIYVVWAVGIVACILGTLTYDEETTGNWKYGLIPSICFAIILMINIRAFL